MSIIKDCSEIKRSLDFWVMIRVDHYAICNKCVIRTVFILEIWSQWRFGVVSRCDIFEILYIKYQLLLQIRPLYILVPLKLFETSQNLQMLYSRSDSRLCWHLFFNSREKWSPTDSIKVMLKLLFQKDDYPIDRNAESRAKVLDCCWLFSHFINLSDQIGGSRPYKYGGRWREQPKSLVQHDEWWTTDYTRRRCRPEELSSVT